MRARQAIRIAAGLLVCGLMVGMFSILGGCGLMGGLAGEYEAVREEATRARDEIAADRVALEQSAAELPAGSAERARVESIAATRATQEAAFARAVERLEAAQAQAFSDAGAGGGSSIDPAGTLEDGAALLAPLVPPGAQLPLILGAGFAASVWRATRLKKSAASIAEGLEKAMAGDDGLREGMKRNAATLRSVQTPTAQRIVDEVKRVRPMVRLPL
jgi:hypothetical protein